MTTELPLEYQSLLGAMDMIQTPKSQLDIESAIMTCAPFDYITAEEIFAALQRRLELRYEDRLNTELSCRMEKLAKSFDNITGNGK